MEEIIASGKADVVLAARALMADPDMPKKARAGKTDEIRPCLRCFVCFSGITTKRQYRCAVNPEIGFEQDCRHELPPAVKKTVLVAGGGVAGMQAALTASQRGHKVILCEKSDRLGGVLRCEEKVPFKKLLSDYLDYQARMISRAPIDVQLGTEVTPELAKQPDADVIIAALGARPVIPKIPGIDGKNVLGAEEAYYHPERTGKNVVILGGGLVGIELAIFLSGLGRKVTIIEMMETLSDGGNPVHGLALINEIKKYGIQVSTATRATEINEKGVIGEYVGSAVYPAAVSDGAGGCDAIEQLRQGSQGRRRGREQTALRRRYGHLCDRPAAASRRGGRAPFLRAGVPSDRRLPDSEKHAAGDRHGLCRRPGHIGLCGSCDIGWTRAGPRKPIPWAREKLRVDMQVRPVRLKRSHRPLTTARHHALRRVGTLLRKQK